MKRTLMVAQIGAIVVAGCLGMAAHADKPSVTGSADPVEQATDTSSSDVEFDEFDTQHFEEEYARTNIERYNALSASPSPRQQVLAGRIYLEQEEETPALIRPRRADVVARAVQLAPDDSFVQWMAADQGSYTSSQCGPTKRPEAEVSNLVRLEPDNAAAWRFAVALASAIGDQAGVDDALSRMASASRADDHSIEQFNEWTKAFGATPEPKVTWEHADSDLSNDDHAMLAGLGKIGSVYSSVASVLLGVCTMEVDNDRIWKRLGWCADAATTLASRGSSLALREEGLALLAVVGGKDEALTNLQRQYDWLSAHNANPRRTYSEDSSGMAVAISDWKDATTEIEAIEHRLKRTAQPLQPPSGWAAKTEPETDEYDDSAQQAWLTYTKSLIDELRTSPDVREQAAAVSISAIAMMQIEDSGSSGDSTGDEKSIEAANAEKNEALARLASANPDNLLVQWMAASADETASGSNAVKNAIGNVQRLDPDNGASWALSLAAASDTADLVLPQIAASTRFDDHSSEILALWTAAAHKQPPTDDLVKAMAAGGDSSAFEDSSYGMGAAMLSRTSTQANLGSAVAGACQHKVDSKSPRLPSCTAIARLLLNSGTTTIMAKSGEQILRHLHALDARDAARVRKIAWWMQVAMPNNPFDGMAMSRYLNDIVESGSEVEALRLGAERAGKAEPPESFRTPAKKKEASEK